MKNGGVEWNLNPALINGLVGMNIWVNIQVSQCQWGTSGTKNPPRVGK